jgi:hypothetical protein
MNSQEPSETFKQALNKLGEATKEHAANQRAVLKYMFHLMFVEESGTYTDTKKYIEKRIKRAKYNKRLSLWNLFNLPIYRSLYPPRNWKSLLTKGLYSVPIKPVMESGSG